MNTPPRLAARLTVISALLASWPSLAVTVIPDGGLLTLSSPAGGAIEFTGNGTLKFADSFTLPNDIIFDSGVTGTINTAAQDDLLSGVLSGAGGMLKKGSGTLTLTGANTYSGGTNLSAGTLAVGSNTALGTGTLTFAGGALLGTANVTLANQVSLGGSLAIAAANGTTLSFGGGGWDFGANAVMTIGDAGNAGTVQWIGSAGTVTAIGTQTVHIAAGTFKGASGQFTTFDLITKAGTLVVDSGATLDLGGRSATAPANFSGAGRITTSSGTPTLSTRGGSFAGVIDGALALAHNSGTLTLTGASTYSGGTTIASGATLQLGDGGAGGSITGDIVNSGSLVANQSSIVTLGGIISGTGSLTQQGSGALKLAGANTFTGGTTIAAGSTLQLSNGGSITGNVANNGSLVVSQSGDLTLGGIISGTGSLTVQGSGTLRLTGANTFAGGTTIGSSASLYLGSGGLGGSITGNVTANGSLVVNRSSNLTLGGVIAGTGTLSQQGSGMLTLTGVNTYSGGTTLSAGTLAVGTGTALGTGTLSLAGGTLLGTADATLPNGLDMSGTFGIAAATGTRLTLGEAPWTLANGTSLIIGKAGAAGTVALGQTAGSSANFGTVNALHVVAGTLTGTWTLYILAERASSLTIDAGATLDLGGWGPLKLSPGSLSGAGRITTSGGTAKLETAGGSFAGMIDGPLALWTFGSGSTLTLTGASTYTGGTSIFTGVTLQLGNGGSGGSITGDVVNTGSLVVNQSSNLTLGGVISSTGTLAQKGSGMLTLTGANTYSGGTTLSAGTLAVGSGTVLGTGTLTLTGGTLLGTANSTLSNELDMGGTFGIAAANGTTLNVGNAYWSLDSNTALTIGKPGAAGTVVFGQTSGGSAVYGGGTKTLHVATGTLTGGVGLGILLQQFGTLTIDAGATLDLGGTDTYLATAKQVSGAGHITSSSGAPTLSTFGGSFSTVIDGGLALNQRSGKLTLTSASTYTGGTTIFAGSTLQLGNGGSGGSITGNVVDNGSLVVNQSSNLALGGIISGSGTLTQQGSGILTLTGANTYSGGTTLSAGTLKVGSDTALGTGMLTVTGGTLQGTSNVSLTNPFSLNGNLRIAAAPGTTLSIATGQAWEIGAGAVMTIGGPGATGTVLWGPTGGGTAVLGSYAVDVAAGTFKAASGVSGNFDLMTYAGSLVVEPGATLDLGGRNATAPANFSGAGRITTSSGTPTLSTRGGSVSGVIDGALALAQTTGTLAFTGSGFYTGGTTIAAGSTLQLGNGGSGGSINGNIANNGSLVVNQSSNLTLGGILSGAGSLAQQGSGTLTLTGANTFTGATTIAAGSTLQLGNGGLGGSLGDIANGGTLVFSGGTLGVGSVAQAQAGSIVTLRSGATVLNGNGITTDNLIVGDSPASATIALATGKTLTIGAETVGNAGNGFLTQNGGTHSANTLLLAANAGVSGIFTLNGGSFAAGSIGVGAGSGRFNLNGGTLSVAGALSVTNFSLGVSASYAGAMTVANALTSLGALSTSGVISVGGSFENDGSFTLAGGTFSGAAALVNNNLLAGYGSIGGSGGFTNYGQIQPSGGGLVLSNTGANGNYGNWDVNAGLPLVLSGTTLSNLGAVNLNSGLISGTGTFSNGPGGILAGRGTITANLTNAGELALTGGALAVTKGFLNAGLIDLRGSTASLSGGAVTNTGIVQGAGTVSAALNNGAGGTVEAIGGTLVLGGPTTNAAGGLMTAATGARLVVLPGLAANAGVIVLSGGTFDNNGQPLSNGGQISGFGTLRASALTNNASIHFSGGNTVVNGDVVNSAGATLTVSYNPATFSGQVVNLGTIKTTSTVVTFTGSFVNNGTYVSDPSTQVFQDLTLGPAGVLQGGPGDVFVVNGNLVNGSQAAARFDISTAKLVLSSGEHRLTWGAIDFGAWATGYRQNFAIGTLELAAGGSLSLLGTSFTYGANALYVHDLLLDGGLGQIASIRSDGVDIFYDPSAVANAYLRGATYSLAGGGSLIAVSAVPEPDSVAMFLAGLGLLAGAARRRCAGPKAGIGSVLGPRTTGRMAQGTRAEPTGRRRR